MIRFGCFLCLVLSTLMVRDAPAQVDVRPVQNAGTTIRVAKCLRVLGPVDCWLTNLVTHAAATEDEWQLALRNPSAKPVHIRDADVVLIGERSGFEGFSNKVTVTPPDHGIIKPLDITAIQLQVTRRGLPRDTYSGSIYLWFTEADGNLEVPILVSVRNGVFLALLALLVGILLGRTVKPPSNQADYEARHTNDKGLIKSVSRIVGVYPRKGEKGLRPFLFGLLLLALLVVGVDAVYASNYTFGSPADYVAALTWGFGADVIKATLGDLPKP